MSISWYELSVATTYGQGKIAESQGKVREFLFPDPVGTLNYEIHCIVIFCIHDDSDDLMHMWQDATEVKPKRQNNTRTLIGWLVSEFCWPVG